MFRIVYSLLDNFSERFNFRRAPLALHLKRVEREDRFLLMALLIPPINCGHVRTAIRPKRQYAVSRHSPRLTPPEL